MSSGVSECGFGRRARSGGVAGEARHGVGFGYDVERDME